MGDTLQILVDFEEHDGKTVHNVQVHIYNADTKVEITSVEGVDFGASEHVHAESGFYAYSKSVPLTTANGFVAHGNYVLEAIVNDHDGLNEEKESVAFYVQPK